MTRHLPTALAIVLFALPVEAQQGEAPSADATGDGRHESPADEKAIDEEMLDEEGLDEEVLDEEAFGDEEWIEDEEVEFCGGDEESIVDLAYAELQAENALDAKAMLVEALRMGQLEPWERGYALVTLAEAQLQLGEHSAAARNYGRALRESPERAGAAARVGLATALYLQHRYRVALDASREAATMACASRYSEVECYAAQLLVASTTRDRTERDAAFEAARALRTSHPELGGSLDELERRLAVSLPVDGDAS